MTKKRTLLFSILLFFGMSAFTQTQSTRIWHEDFDSLQWDQYGLGEGPEGWILRDNTGNDFNWRWSLEGPRGRYTSPDGQMEGDSSFVPSDPLGSTTFQNGFMMLEADYFNTDELGAQVFPLIEMDAFIQTPAIDFSDYAGAVFRIQQSFRYSGYTDQTHISVLISTDFDPSDIDSGNWYEFSLKGDVSATQYSDDPDVVELNISSLVAGEETVYFRFLMSNTAQYYWMIDDIEILEPFDNDLIIERFWADYVNEPDNSAESDSLEDWSGGYVSIPEILVQEFVSFRAAVTSMGMETQSDTRLNVNITKDGTEVYDENSEAKVVDFFDESMFSIETTFTPSGIGHYQVSATIFSEDQDSYPSNNHALFEFDVDNTLYSRSTNNPDNYSYTSTSILGGGADGNNLCVVYDIPATDIPIDFASVTTYIHPYFDTATIEYGNASMIARVYAFNESTNNFEISPLRSSDNYQLQVSDIGNFVTLPLLEDGTGTIMPGKYAVGFEFFMAGSNRHFLIGNDRSVFEPTDVAYVLVGTEWDVIDHNPVIQLDIKLGTSVQDNFAHNKFNVSQNFPNPFSNSTEISYTLNKTSKVSFEIYDITGKQVMFKDLGIQDVGENTIELDALDFKAGIYMYRLSTDTESQTRRMIISY